MRFAVQSDEGRAPSPEWGLSGAGAHIVRIRSSDRLKQLESISPGSLKAPPPGTVTELVLGHQLEGPVSSFGTVFWDEILAVAPDLQERLKTQKPIKEVYYQDRYVRGPLPALLVAEIVAGLLARSGTVAKDVTVRLLTSPPTGNYTAPSLIEHDWETRGEAIGVIEALFKTKKVNLDLTMKKVKSLPHERLLKVIWEDGHSWRTLLEHGIGFVSPADRQTHPFEMSPTKQGKTLARSKIPVKTRNPGRFFVYPVE